MSMKELWLVIHVCVNNSNNMVVCHLKKKLYMYLVNDATRHIMFAVYNIVYIGTVNNCCNTRFVFVCVLCGV